MTLLGAQALAFCSWSIFLLGKLAIVSLILAISLTMGRDRVGWSLRGDTRSPLWSLASALLVSGACRLWDV
jgi:hypothetical protein